MLRCGGSEKIRAKTDGFIKKINCESFKATLMESKNTNMELEMSVIGRLYIIKVSKLDRGEKMGH